MKYLIFLFPGILKYEVIKADLFRYAGKTDMAAFRKALLIPGFEFTLYFRLCSIYHKYSCVGAWSRLMNTRLTYKFGFQIPRKTKIGRGLRISHFGALVVNYDSMIGENCYLSHNVTIGQAARGEKKGSPVIGDKVWIGPGAVIVGKVLIGNSVLIAPNSFVNMDVPNNSIVIGNPARIIEKENATQDYITNIYT